MDSLAIRFVDYLLECRYIGPNVPGSVGITERNLVEIYNNMHLTGRSPQLPANTEVTANALLTFMRSNNYLTTQAGGQVSGFPRHNIDCPVNSSASVRINMEEVRRMKMTSRSPLSLVVGDRPSRQLVSSLTKALSNVVILSDVQGSEVFDIPGYRNYREGRVQVSVHRKLNVERLRTLPSGGSVVWLSVSEPGLWTPEGDKKTRVTLIGVVSSLAAGAEQNLSSEMETIMNQIPADCHVDPLLLLLSGAHRSSQALQQVLAPRQGLQLVSYQGRELVVLHNSGVEYEVRPTGAESAVTTVVQDRRFCSIFEMVFRTRQELEQHVQSKKYQKAKLYKYYQHNKSKLLKSSHELGLEIEVVEKDSGVEIGVEEEGVVTIVAKPNEEKKFKIKLRNNRIPEGMEETDPNNPKGIILDRFGVYGQEDPVFQFEDPKGLVRGTKLRLKYEKKMRVTVKAKSSQIGHYRVPVLVGFYHEIHSQTQYDARGAEAHVLQHLGLELLLKVQTDEMRELRPRAPYVARKKVNPWHVRSTVPGTRLEYDESLDQLPKQLRLEQFNIEKVRNKVLNGNFQECDNSDPAEKAEFEKCQKLLEASLSAENYSQRWQLLLHCEEKQLQMDIRHYDMSGVVLTKTNNLFSLHVPGLEENRPSVMKGDKIFVKHSSDQGRDYEGFVHEIQEQRVLIGFAPQFRDNFVRNMKFDVKFTVSRFPLRNMHRAVSLVTGSNNDLLRVLFPSNQRLAATFSLLNPSELRCYNRLIEENPEQLAAVRHILAGSSGGCPYLIFGPPGTGKTVTLVEAMKQMVKLDRNVHILASAPSNTAADLITERLLQHLNKGDIIRIHANSRVISSISQSVLRVSNVEGDKIRYPRLEELMKYKVIVTTLVTAGRLVTAQFPSNHFSHVVMDETGQATEPEAAIALAGVMGLQSKLVMAGDPKQLGPVIRSLAAVKHGLNISLLERLMETELYSRSNGGQYDPRCITKLVRNFRSHPNLLTVPKQLFYNNELDACADQALTESCLTFEGLPLGARNNKVPMIFHGVIGQDQKEETSPSFFNIEEIIIVRDYIKNLCQMRENKVKPKEIGVIAPYRRQVQKLRQKLRSDGLEEVMVGSTEEFQGQERRVIIVSTVRSTPQYVLTDKQYKLGFLQNPKRFNVAITRSKALLIIVGNPHILSQDNCWRPLLEFSLAKGCYTGCSYQPETEDVMDQLAVRMKKLLVEDADITMMTQMEEPAWRSGV